GKASPSAVAVLRFTTISNLVGNCTGRSPGFSPRQDAIHIGGGATPGVYQVGSVGEQTAAYGIVRCRIDRRYLVPGRRRYDRGAMCGLEEYIRHEDKPASRLAPKGDDGRCDLRVAMYGRSNCHDLECPGRRLK